MNVKNTVRMLAGSLAIYIVVAACSGAGGGFIDAGTTGTGGDAASTPHDGAIQRLMDALTDPVAAASADPTQSGTRLKVQSYVGSDGSSLVAGMYDSQLQTQCSFGLASDGTTRCLPSAGYPASVGSYFADSGCSKELAWLPQTGCTPSYARSYSETCGGQVQTIFSVSGAFSGTPYTGTPSACVSSAIPTGDSLYSIGAELPPSTFVQATLTTGS
jgi:hypothetical protein